MRKENVLIAISSCNKIIDIFLGPFLVAYFIKTSVDSLIDLSVYKMLSYFFLVIVGVVVGYFIEKNHGLAMFRIGVVLRFIYILLIILLKEEIVNHIGFISFMWGVSAIAFWFPYNMYNIYSVENSRRTIFEANKKNIAGLLAVLVPIILGTMITTTNYQMTATVILFISFLEIVCSFYLKPLPKYESKYNIVKVFKKMKNDKGAMKLLRLEFFAGLCISDAALSVLITIFIVESFKTDMNLGIINSISAIITLFIIHLYSRKVKKENDKIIICLSCFVILISALILCFFKTPITVIIYSVIFEMLASGILSLMEGVRINNFNRQKVSLDDINEFMSIREGVLNLGRIISFFLVMITAFLGVFYLNYVFIFLNIMMVLLGRAMASMERFE